MPEPAESHPAIAPASEPPNVFLAPDSACDPNQSADAERDADGIWAPADLLATPSLTAAPLPSRRRSGRTRLRRRLHPPAMLARSWVAAVAVAVVTAMFLGLALDQPAGPPPSPGDRVRPATSAPTSLEPPGTRHRPHGAKARKSPRAPTARARSRLRPAARAAARRRATRRRKATRQRPNSAPPSASPVPSPDPSPAPYRTPAPTRAIRRAPALPMPVPPSAPPEFM
jgi:DNA polymerase-3 subunit gamma/tau